jgi:hypothetical protein
VSIRVANAHAENAVAIDHCHDFVVRGDHRFALSRQESHHAVAIPKAAKRQLADHAWVAKQAIILNNPAQLGIDTAEMINPDRGIC